MKYWGIPIYPFQWLIFFRSTTLTFIIISWKKLFVSKVSIILINYILVSKFDKSPSREDKFYFGPWIWCFRPLLTQYIMVIRKHSGRKRAYCWCHCISFPFQRHTEWFVLFLLKGSWQYHGLAGKPSTWTFSGLPRPKLWQLLCLTVSFS